MLPVPPMRVVSAWNPPAQPPLPYERMIPFQFVGVGSQTSIPMPGDVDGAAGSPGLPGPTSSLTRHTSAGAAAGAGSAGVPASAMGDPAAKACTSSTVVRGSGRKRCLMPSSQLAVGGGAGTVLELGGAVGVDAGAQPGTDRHTTVIAAAATADRTATPASASNVATRRSGTPDGARDRYSMPAGFAPGAGARPGSRSRTPHLGAGAGQPGHRGVPGPRGHARRRVGPKDAKMGQEGAWTADVSFDDVHVPAERSSATRCPATGRR